VVTQTPNEALDAVLAHGGASLPARDPVDVRIAEEVRTGTAHGPGGGIVNSQQELGGWPELASLPAPADGDHDGMPDAWERREGLDPADPADGGRIAAGGYSNLERYLNSLVKP
jgi:hypothetical protein